jgi:hypothetical protein
MFECYNLLTPMEWRAAIFWSWSMWATKFTLGAQKSLMVENKKIGMVKIGFK